MTVKAWDCYFILTLSLEDSLNLFRASQPTFTFPVSMMPATDAKPDLYKPGRVEPITQSLSNLAPYSANDTGWTRVYRQRMRSMTCATARLFLVFSSIVLQARGRETRNT
jgi:hypothetical protein